MKIIIQNVPTDKLVSIQSQIIQVLIDNGIQEVNMNINKDPVTLKPSECVISAV